MKHLIATFIAILGVASVLPAQTLPFRTYSIENGLSQAVVNDVMQDNSGYLWVGTNYGLNRFDGSRFTNYYAEDGLLDNSIHSLYEDDTHRLWIGTGGGVNVLKSDSIHTLPELKPLEQSTILAIYKDSRGRLWFATDGEGVWQLDREKELTQYQEAQGLGANRVRAIVEDRNGVIWFATRDGLTGFYNGDLKTFTSQQGLPDNRLRDIAVKDDHSLWVASRGGLCEFRNTRFRCYTESDGLVNNRIQSISLDEQGSVWIGTEEGASFFNGKTFSNYSVDEGLSNNIIYSTHLDREGNIWFGTYGGGISIFMGAHFENYSVDEGLPNNMVTSIAQDKSGRHWISTFGGGIARLNDNATLTIYNEQDGLINNKVYTIVGDKEDDRLIIGTHWGLSIYNHQTFTNYDQDELESRKIRSVLDPQQSEGFWLSTYENGVLLYQNEQFQSFTEEDGLASNTVLASVEGDDGAIWFATYGGVSRWFQGEFTNYTIRDGLPNNGVLDVLKDDRGRVWVSTFGGIAVFNGQKFQAITPSSGLPDEVCYFIEQDDAGLFWIGANKGVIRFDYESYQSEEEPSQAFQLFTQNQGLVANEMNAGASFKDQDGSLWFGSVGGLTKFTPSLLRANNSAPIVHVENMSISGEDTPITSGLQIDSDNHNITFDFIGLFFSAPEQLTYQYRLKNFSEQWQQTDQRSVRYSALMPGDYTFQVRAQSHNGRWSSETAQVSFTILAPFWLQWWFIVLVLLTIIGIIFFIYNYYRAKKMIEIERMRVRIASDLHDDVGSALTEIALQSDFLQTMDVDENLQESLRQMGSQSRKVVSSLDDIVWSIDARNDTMGDLTDRMQDYVNSVLSQKKINYHFEGDMQEKLDVPLKENLYLIFKEAINNISKHSNASTVDITLSTNGQGFLMSIKDNGDTPQNERKSGQGLRNMNMRAKRIDANISFSNKEGFEVKVEDSH